MYWSINQNSKEVTLGPTRSSSSVAPHLGWFQAILQIGMIPPYHSVVSHTEVHHHVETMKHSTGPPKGSPHGLGRVRGFALASLHYQLQPSRSGITLARSHTTMGKPIKLGHNPLSQLVFSLDSKQSVVVVQVITIGSQLAVIDPQHRHIGQWSNSKHDNHHLLAPWLDRVQCGFTIAFMSNTSVKMWATPSFRHMNHLCTSQHHRCIA
jgi:hypothetical protein